MKRTLWFALTILAAVGINLVFIWEPHEKRRGR